MGMSFVGPNLYNQAIMLNLVLLDCSEANVVTLVGRVEGATVSWFVSTYKDLPY